MLIADLRHACRRLCSDPLISGAGVLMLGLAIGLAMAMFASMNALFFRSVPFQRADQLASLYMGDEHGGRLSVTPSVLRAWRENPAFAGVESADTEEVLIEADGVLASRSMARVTPGVFGMLGGVQPVRGRLFEAGEGHAGADDSVLVSESVWRGLFNADPTLVGRRIKVGKDSVLVVGILPSTFRFPSWDTALWRPTAVEASSPGRPNDRYTAYVRFATNVPRQAALRQAAETARSIEPANVNLQALVRPLVTPNALDQRAGALLGSGVVFVFLVLCLNVSGLLLTRVISRRRDCSIAAALGASRARLMRQAAMESTVIGALGVVVGVGIGWLFVSLLRAFLPEAYLMRTLHPVSLDTPAFLVAAVSGMVATMLVGLVPAWLGGRANAVQSIQTAGRGGTQSRTARLLTRSLLVAQIALAVMLLLPATLLVRSFLNLTRAERGLDVAGVLTATLSLPNDKFPDRAARAVAAGLVEEQVRQLPGVDHLAWSYGLPPDGAANSNGTWIPEGTGARPAQMSVDRYRVGPDFFVLYGIPLLRGRSFLATDTDREVLIGARLARILWPNADPVGRGFRVGTEQFQVIGVVQEVRYPSLNASLDRPELYQRFSGIGRYSMLSISARDGHIDPQALRQRLLAAHPSMKVGDVRRLEDVYAEQLALPRAAAALALLFASIALLTAAGGLLCTLCFAVSLRRREFGIRVAVGATSANIGALVLREGGSVSIPGIALGALGAWSLARTIATLEYEVHVSDPMTWCSVLGAIAVVLMAACWRPSRDAMCVDPGRLLKEG